MTSPYNQAFPTGCNARGIRTAGDYGQYQYPGTNSVIAANMSPSATVNSTTVNLATLLDTISLPASGVGPDGWYELWVDWSCTNSANNKVLQIWIDANATHCDDNQTTNIANTVCIRIGNKNNTSANMMQGAPNLGGHSVTFINVNLDFSVEGHSIALWAGITNAADTMRVERWMLTAHNPPVYSKPRLQYGKPMFWGANGHFDDSQTIAQHIAGLKTMGMKLMRITWEGPTSLATLVAYAQAFQADNTGLQLYVCLDFGITGYANEMAAYVATFQACFTVVAALAPYGVTLFECGNEMDTKDGINIGDPQGGRPSDFSPALTNIFRGTQRGAVDAVHAVNPAFTAASNAFTVCSIGLSDCMVLGINTDGSPATTGPIKYDAIAWHNYEDYGSLVGVQTGNSRPWVNILQYVNRRYGGIPIFISEWNAKQSDTDVQRANWANRIMYDMYTLRYKYNIASVMVYALYGSPWNVLDGSNAPLATFGQTVQTFITANPDTGL